MAAAFGGMNTAIVVVWEWTNDQGEWSPYEADVSNFIEDNYASQSNIIRLADIDRNFSSLAVDLNRMLQVSKHGIERPVRRQLYNSDSAVAHGATWQWGGDSSRQRNARYMWHSYSMDVANQLEAAYSWNRYSVVDLDVSPINQPYVVDLSQMKQINKTSGFARPIQRLLTGANYRMLSSGSHQQQQSNVKSQSWQQYLGSFFPSGSTSNFGSSGFGIAGSSGSSGFGSSSDPGLYRFGSTPQPNPMTASAPGYPNTASAMGATSLPSTGSHLPSGFNFSSSSYQPAGQTMFSFSGGSSSSTGSSMPPPAAASSSTQAPGAQPKRLRVLRKNLTPGFSSDAASSSLQSGSTSNWNFDANGPMSGAAPGMSANAFSVWRDPSNQTGSNSLGKSGHYHSNPPPATASNGIGNSSSSGSSTSLFGSMTSQLLSGLSGMAISTYRYIKTGGNLKKSVSTSVASSSVVPATDTTNGAKRGAEPIDDNPKRLKLSENSDPQEDLSQVPLTLTTNAAKSGARSIGGNYVNTKRLKVSGTQTISVPQEDLSHVQKLTAADVLANYIKEVKKPPAKEDCCICCDSLREASGYGQGNSYTVVQLVKCSHMFHVDCIAAMYDSSSKNGSVQCPSCKTIYGTKYGNCPNGNMEYAVIPNELPGYSGCSAIEIKYAIFPGLQGHVHPKPGHPYTVRGFPRYGYLPNNHEGQKVLALLITAWRRRLTFTIGTSVTTGEADVVVWNEIHHKTEKTDARGHGYPDPNYLGNVMSELAAHGVTDDSM